MVDCALCKSQSPVASVASVGEMKRKKLTDEAIFGMVTKSPDQRRGNPRVPSKTINFRGRAFLLPSDESNLPSKMFHHNSGA